MKTFCSVSDTDYQKSHSQKPKRNASYENYPHTKDEVTKQILKSKLKAIKQKYRQAFDSGRRSEHGRVVCFTMNCVKWYGAVHK